MGSHRYTWAGLGGLDRKLADHFLGLRAGTFVELGGNDGLQQSNTLALEELFGWRGVLIEPDPELAAECRRNRPNATVVCAAAGADWSMARLSRGDLMSTLDNDAARESVTSLVPVAPISEILSHAGLNGGIDLISLDVEGHELAVLKGLDLDRHQPSHLLVETSDPNGVAAALGPSYARHEAWSHHDHFYSRT